MIIIGLILGAIITTKVVSIYKAKLENRRIETDIKILKKRNNVMHSLQREA